MNYLAHLYLSGDDEEIMTGNFIADAVKGKKILLYSDEVQNGIRIHRAIDQYTDHHPVVLSSIHRLQPTYHKYAGVIVDMAYDHFLSKYWEEFSNMKLQEFISGCYAVLLKKFVILPSYSKRMLPFMIMSNWLSNYSKLEGLNRSFVGMSRRTKYKSGMENAVRDIQKDYDLYLEEFRSFFPDLIKMVEGMGVTIPHKL